MTVAWWCAIEDAGRARAERCAEQCPNCVSLFRDENRPVTTMETEPTGTFFDFADPTPEMVHLIDIARSLSQKVRFGGHTSHWYSVAEHVLLVRSLVVEAGHPELGLAALHHDSHEAYIDDIPTPLKTRMEQIAPGIVAALQEPCDMAIAAKFDFDPELFRHPVVKQADLLALFREAATLKASRGVGPHWGRTEPAEALWNAGLSPLRAEELFLRAHEEEMECQMHPSPAS